MTKGSWILLFGSFITLEGCNQHQDADSPLSQNDTVAVLQTVLNDQNLVTDAALYLPELSLKLIQNKVVKPNYLLTFDRQAVKVVAIKEEGREVREAYPKQFIVSFPMFKAINNDTVLLSMIVHSGNSTHLYTISQDDGRWQILSDQRGKF